MMLCLFLSVILGLGLSLFVCPSPVILGLWILLISFFSCMIMGMVSYSWLGMFIYVIYVGGLLVMFSYFVALSPNRVYVGQSMGGSFIMGLVTSLFIFWSGTTYVNSFIGEKWISMMPYLYMNNLFLFIFMGLSLFIAMVSVVKLCGCHIAPLRGFN